MNPCKPVIIAQTLLDGEREICPECGGVDPVYYACGYCDGEGTVRVLDENDFEPPLSSSEIFALDPDNQL